jgi:hypothetical protein
MTDRNLLDFSFAPVGGNNHMMPPPSSLNYSLMMNGHSIPAASNYADISFQQPHLFPAYSNRHSQNNTSF